MAAGEFCNSGCDFCEHNLYRFLLCSWRRVRLRRQLLWERRSHQRAFACSGQQRRSWRQRSISLREQQQLPGADVQRSQLLGGRCVHALTLTAEARRHGEKQRIKIKYWRKAKSKIKTLPRRTLRQERGYRGLLKAKEGDTKIDENLCEKARCKDSKSL